MPTSIPIAVLLAITVSAVPPHQPAAAAEPARPACPASQPDHAHAQAAAAVCGGRVEVLAARSETTKIYAEPDGSQTAEIHSGVVRVKDALGGWQDVDLNLERRADGSVVSRVHPVGLTLAGAGGAGDHDLASLGAGAEQVVVGWRGKLPEPVLDGTKATYAEVKPGVDLVVEVTRTGFESFLIVKNRAAAAHVASVVAPWRAHGLAPKSGANGAIDLVDSKGAVRGQMSKAYMWDATIDARSGEPARKVPVDVTLGGPELRLTPNAGFLADPKTTYPVTIDPQWDIWAAGGHHDTWVQSDGSTGWNDPELKIGSFNNGGTVARSFILFDLAPFFGTYINWATLHMYETWAFSCRDAEWQVWTSGYADHTTTWSNQVWVGYHHSSSETTGYDSCESDGWVNIDARNYFQQMADTSDRYSNLGLRGGAEWSSDSWKRFRSSNSSYGDPQVTINFHYPPTVTAMGTTPSTACVVGANRPHLSSIPQLSAVLSDPEGATTWSQFEWWVTGGSSPIGTAASGPAPSGGWQPAVTIPAADLPDGGTYSWRARGHDGVKWSGWSGWCEFTVDSQAPTAMSTSLPSPCVFTPGVTDTGPLPRLNPNNAGAGLTLKARVDDVNGGATRAEFEWALKTSSTPMGSVITPAPGLASGSTFTTTVPAATFSEGQAYSWRVRGHDGGFVKPWSQWCEFVVDTTAPGVPTVTPDPGNDLALAPFGVTPPNPSATAVVGRPTQVRFRPAGGTDPNVVAYLWGLNTAAPDRWAPAGSDGTAVVTVTVEPLLAGFTVNRLTVLAVDRAGNRSALPAGQDYSYGFKAHPAAGWWVTTGTAGPIPNVVSTGAPLTLSSGASLGYGGLTLTGSSSQATTPAAVVNTTAGYTVAAWARPTNLSGDRVVLSQDGASENGFRLLARGGTWCFGAPAADAPAPAYHEVCGGTTANGVWTHVAGVYDPAAQTLALYVDGGLAGTTPRPTAWAATGAFAVGRGVASGTASGRFVGDVADIRAWQRILDPAGIAALAKLPPNAGRWGMDDPASAVAADLSGLTADHDATLAGSAAWAAGRTGYGLRTAGVGAALTASGPAIRTDRSFTVSAWVNVTASTPWYYHAVSQDGTTTSGFFLGEAGGVWGFTRTPSDASAEPIRAYSTAPMARNTWTHLTGVYDASAGQIRLYVNGAHAATTACACSWHANGPFVIGRAKWNSAQTDWWPGGVDDVRVFAGVLSNAQIAYLATQ